jgi:polyisoprenoid-binding protein YceI
MDCGNLTGNLAVQGATDAVSQTVEWYDIPFEDLKTGNVVSNVSFTTSTERLGFNVEGYHPYLRLQVQVNGGNVDLIQYR